ncbi:NlpC/P60 family protein [Burkholderia multivorans]|uniref:C40 family peptidase n=1 Tax=Burkholderia multivorans TaxID=87883 RepID=UPI001C214533|nr:NlpC/P60 family protein [Burkholderia multivorans]MBU9608255.1 C40 family peptidase [Burkholderia multivorans]MCA8248069.1 NlpC/P60 family protein [Burkholderia multivorans]
MITRDAIVTEARTWLGTPYRHQGRIKGIAVDCVGLVIGVCQALGIPCRDETGYSRRPDGTLTPALTVQTLPVEGLPLPGDIAVFHWQGESVHLAIVTGEDRIIHALAINRRVCEHRLDERMQRMIKMCRRIPGVGAEAK